ncbi:MAG: phage protein Gp27 family protein [Shimia sp.]
MPPPRKVDLIPESIRSWLQETLKARGFAGYEEITEELNWRLAEEGEELRVGKTAVHAYGAEFRDYARAQQQAEDEMRVLFQEMTARDEVDVTSVLFQQLSTLAFRSQMAIAQSEDGTVDPKGLKDMSQALNNLIRSRELRERILADERKAMGAKLEAAVDAGDIDAQAAERARQIMGFG